MDLPAVRTEAEAILRRTIEQAFRRAEFEDLVLWTRPVGSRLHLGDVATVVGGFEEADQQPRFGVETAMMVSVFRTGNPRAIEFAGLQRVRRGTRGRARPRACRSGSARTRRRYRAVSARTCCGTSFAGFVLVFPVLTLFSVELRLAFWGASVSRPRSSARSR